ncbi:UDP-glucuronic acid decarboxylase family protein [Belliella kenyensis]|uniref:UDP-glucuronic acid decarboxylase family protein n=1 Tax=Belliella kenyensis TaxID=1472724 RepID=A0ABV8EHE7_9BACT|nr:UDP-glucuronic acid decarboxylase family protein [Belliella kenyensis]MCH7402649.1 SDR family oxidoreductase [Belliella kenyensis]MDN3603803.1 SDR family oxidoreductase [Belliella kenyensis]
MKKVLITGGAGFLGSTLSRRLVNEGCQVYCLDNLSTGFYKNIIDLLPHPNFEFILHDVTDPIHIEVDEIYNLACPASPEKYQADPIKTMRTSVIGAMNLLELATKTKAKILQASTSEVYGDPKISPQPEGYFGNVNINGIRSCYDEGKRAAETLFTDYHRQYGTRIKIMRIFNTYGPAMDMNDGRVVSNFIVQALKNEPITIYGEGSQTRSFCYVDDNINGMLKLMKSPEEITFPINIGNPVEFNMLELANLILNLTGSKSKLVYKNLPQDDPLQRKPNISLARQVLSWEPRIGLADGLLKTIAYFQKEIDQSLVAVKVNH